MHTYDGCEKVLCSVTSTDVAEFVEDNGIEMTDEEFKRFCDFVGRNTGDFIAERLSDWISGDYTDYMMYEHNRRQKCTTE